MGLYGKDGGDLPGGVLKREFARSQAGIPHINSYSEYVDQLGWIADWREFTVNGWLANESNEGRAGQPHYPAPGAIDISYSLVSPSMSPRNAPRPIVCNLIARGLRTFVRRHTGLGALGRDGAKERRDGAAEQLLRPLCLPSSVAAATELR